MKSSSFSQRMRWGRDARDGVRFIPRVYVPIIMGRGELLAVLASLVEVLAVRDDLRPKAADRFHLDGIGALRHADDGLDAEQAGGIGDRLSVVPGRCRDDTPTPLIFRQLRDEIDPTADLERTDWLMVFVLDPGLRADQLVECRVAVEGRGLEVGGDSIAGGEHVVQRGKFPSLTLPHDWGASHGAHPVG